MRDKNTEFTNAYNTLDNYLKNLLGGKENTNPVALLEQLLPPTESAMLKTLRKFKNDMNSHQTVPGFKKAIAPTEWVKFLKRITNYCVANKDKIRRGLFIELKKRNSYNSSYGHSKPSYNAKTNQYGQNQNNRNNYNRPRRNPNITKCSFCPYSADGKCTNYSYYYNGTRLSSPTPYGRAMATKKKDPCPYDALRKFEEYLKRH